MEYKVMIDQFEGPLDLLLHLIKEADLDIVDIQIEEITKQYFDYIHAMEQLNLNVASEYLIMAAELMEMKSRQLLPQKEEMEEEEDPKQNLIVRLLEYQQYKELAPKLKELEEERHMIFSKLPSNLREFQEEFIEVVENDSVDRLVEALSQFLARKNLEKPLETTVTTREYSMQERNCEIKHLLSIKKQIVFEELFDIMEKDYIVITFLSILDLARKQELEIVQERNFDPILLKERSLS